MTPLGIPVGKTRMSRNNEPDTDFRFLSEKLRGLIGLDSSPRKDDMDACQLAYGVIAMAMRDKTYHECLLIMSRVMFQLCIDKISFPMILEHSTNLDPYLAGFIKNHGGDKMTDPLLLLLASCTALTKSVMESKDLEGEAGNIYDSPSPWHLYVNEKVPL